MASHQRACAAQAAGRFKDEICPIHPRILNGHVEDGELFSVDELPRAETSLEVLAKLSPSFTAKGTVTAGNASPLSDGAAALVLMSEAKAKALGITPLGRIVGFTSVGVAPDIMGTGPVPAITKVLEQTGLKMEDDIDLVELNEAFAAQALFCQKALKIPTEKLNVNGGAIALGHPLGCTGAKLTTSLLYELNRRAKTERRSAAKPWRGIVSMCIGGRHGRSSGV